MQPSDMAELAQEVRVRLAAEHGSTFAIVGHTPEAYELVELFASRGVRDRLLGIFDASIQSGDARLAGHPLLRPLAELRAAAPGVLVVASDAEKERLLRDAAPFVGASTAVLFAGYSHFEFHDATLDGILQESLVPSLANGYPHTLVHIYQCLQNAARLNLDGIVAEFGMFKGGTTMVLARVVEALGRSWRVIGFDTFAGFPPRRSVLDMYAHPGCVFHDEQTVRRYLSGRNVEIVSGDICETAARLKDERVLLAFIDTDNHTSALAAIDAVRENVPVGGAIVFDHFTGRRRFKYTLGERMAAAQLLEDPRYFNLHDTGVFMRQR